MDRSTTVLAFVGGLIAALLVVLIVVVATRGGDGGGAADTAATSSTTTEGTTTTAATTTTVAPGTTAAPTTTDAPSTTATTHAATTSAAPPATRCEGLASMALPSGVELIGGNGNFDGPPEPASVMNSDAGFVFQDVTGWYVGFSLNSGYVVYQALPASLVADFEPTAVIWNFDGDDGILVNTDFSMMSGASVYRFYFLDQNCAVRAAGTVDSDPYEFLDWFGANHTQGFSCAGTGVFETTAGETAIPGNWDVRERFFGWTAPVAPGFEFQFEDGMEVPFGDPAIAAAGMVDC